MKKTFLAVAFVTLATAGAFAQGKKLQPAKATVAEKAAIATTPTATTAATPAEPTTTIKFKTETHDFGTLQEGDPAEAEFTFTNTGSKPLIIQNVQPGCGCTTPFWSKDPVAPGKTGVIKAAYGTKGRVGAFNKNITVTSTAGTNVIYIKGTVEKAPEGSVPQNGSMMKTN
ncbi:DUF1573 domain-containing protein [Taibaiella koreensis]|uniref:DUF1573 domain-containing protein n=1 Tax=Taibaiella koreensis TaxID=1268548 RepID=UPI000E5993EC|nr:DUF1573 domain-containing protein [Taibaiella koreensis]